MTDNFLAPMETSVEVDNIYQQEEVVAWFMRHGFSRTNTVWAGAANQKRTIRINPKEDKNVLMFVITNELPCYGILSQRKNHLSFLEFMEKTAHEDWRVCIDSTKVEALLTTGKSYLVNSNTFIDDKGAIRGVESRRFKKIEPNDWRQCIDVRGKPDLTFGKLYKVAHLSSLQDSKSYVHFIDDAGTYRMSKFSKKENNNMEKKIFGYEAPMDMKSGVKKGDVFTPHRPNNNFYSNETTVLIPAELVEQWAPVYKIETFRAIRLSKHNKEIIIEKDSATTLDCNNNKITLDIEALKKLSHICIGTKDGISNVLLHLIEFDVEGIRFTADDLHCLIKNYVSFQG